MSNIKVIEIKGVKPGKTSVILAGVHGNEICGVEAFDCLIPKLNVLAGKVVFIYANLEAIRQNKRFIDKNLNRCFIKNQSSDIAESLEGRTAKEVMPFLEEADAMLDIHASYTLDSQPFVICDNLWINKAEILDAEIVSYNWDEFHPGSTDYYMNLQGKPAFCYECGYLGDKSSAEKAKRAIENFLVWTGNCSGTLKIKESQEIIKIKSIYKNSQAPFTKAGYFADFTRLKTKTLIGKEGDKYVYGKQGEILLFVRDCPNINDECFLIAEKMEKPDQKIINQQGQTKSRRRGK